MAEQPDQNRPIIIKKVKKGHGAHHGGAWKIAYADFVTAMMAFFLLMWLLGSVGAQDLKGIAQYFANPTKVTLEGGKNAGMSESLINGGGTDLTRKQGQEHNSNQPNRADIDTEANKHREEHKFTEEEARKKIEEEDRKRIENLKKELESMIKVDPALKAFKDQIRLDITRDGLRIQILDKENRPMFKLGSSQLEPYAAKILKKLTPVINKMPNRLSISGHTDARPFVSGNRTNWELSTDRANAARREMVSDGYATKKLLRISGMADALPFVKGDPMDPRNRRISIIVMKDSATQRILHPLDFKSHLPKNTDGKQGGAGSAARTGNAASAPAGSNPAGATGPAKAKMPASVPNATGSPTAAASATSSLTNSSGKTSDNPAAASSTGKTP